MDAFISQFKDVTGCPSDEEARGYLVMYNNNVERAIDRYFHRQNREFVASVAREAVPGPSNASAVPARRLNDTIDIDDDDVEFMDTNGPPPPKKQSRVPSAVVTRSSARSAAVVNGNAAAGVRNGDVPPERRSRRRAAVAPAPVNAANGNGDEVRQPIRAVVGQMVPESFDQSWRPQQPAVAAGAFQAAVNLNGLQQAYNVQIPHQRQQVDRPNGRLHSLFQPPVDLILLAPWEIARQQATISDKWLLVNLQKNSEFACACLNRDVWSQSAVKAVVRNNFIFWQMSDDSSEGKRVASYYGVDTYPYVMAVDPRTGEKVKRFERIRDAQNFLDDVTDFLSTFPDFASYDQHISNVFGNAVANASNADVFIEEAHVPPRKRRRDSDEDEMGTTPKKKKSVEPEKAATGGNEHVDEEMQVIDELCTNGTKLTTVDSEEWRNYIGPCSSSTRQIHLKIRLPNNANEKIDLPATTPLKAVFVYVDGRGFNSREHVLILSYPRREYFVEGHQSQTLEQLGFNSQEVIHVDHR